MWTSRVVEFDARSRHELLQAISALWLRRLTTTGRTIVEWMARVNRAFYFGPAGYIWLGIVAMALVIALVALLRALRRYRAVRRALDLRDLPPRAAGRLIWQLGFYLDLLVTLRQHGIAKPTWQPPRAFASTLASERPRVAELVTSAVELYYESRYAGRPLTREEIARARSLVDQVRQELSG